MALDIAFDADAYGAWFESPLGRSVWADEVRALHTVLQAFASESFDAVVAITVLCFVADAEASLREMARTVRHGGRVAIGELARWNTWAFRRRIQGWRRGPPSSRLQRTSRRQMARPPTDSRARGRSNG